MRARPLTVKLMPIACASMRARAVRTLGATLAFCLVTGVGVAFAAETPVVLAPAEVAATSAVLQGVLNPKSTGELGAQYHFVYRAATTGGCEGAEQRETPSAEALGAEAEAVQQRVEELAPGTRYIVCLANESASHTTVVSNPLTFETAIRPKSQQKWVRRE